MQMGRPLLPAAAMMELAAATAATLAADSASDEGALLAVKHLTMSAPIILNNPDTAAAADDQDMIVTCSIDTTTGSMQLGYTYDGAAEECDSVTCATATAGVVADVGYRAGVRESDQQRLQAGAAAVLADIFALHAAAAASATAPTSAGEDIAAIGDIDSVLEDWHCAGYFSSPRQVDSSLHLGAIDQSQGAKVPVALNTFLVPAAAARRGSATGRLTATAAKERATSGQAANGIDCASFLLSSGGRSGVSKGLRSPRGSCASCASGGELVVLVDGLQTKLVKQSDMIRQQKMTAEKAVPRKQATAQSAAAAAEVDESRDDDDDAYPCTYEQLWQVSEPTDSKSATATYETQPGLSSRHTGKLSVVMHDDATPEQPAAAAAATAVQLTLHQTHTSAGAAAGALAVLQQVNQVQAAAAGRQSISLHAELGAANTQLGPADGLQDTATVAAAAVSTSAIWGLLRTAATEQSSTAVSLLDTDGATQRHAAATKLHLAEHPGVLEALAVRGGGRSVPRLLPVAQPESAEWFTIRPEPRSSLANLVARAVNIGQVRDMVCGNGHEHILSCAAVCADMCAWHYMILAGCFCG